MMITILVLVTLALTNALEPENQNSAEVKSIVSKYFQKVPDIDSKYVLNQGLSKAIWRYFKGKVNAFPLFKIQLKIDRNPVEIPWELGEHNSRAKIKDGQKYKIMRVKPKRRPTPRAVQDVSTDTTTKSQASTGTTKLDVSKQDTSSVAISTTEKASSTDAVASQPLARDQAQNATTTA